MKKWIRSVGIAVLFLALPSVAAADVQPLLTRIKSIGKEGAGNVEAAKALRELTNNGPEVLTDILAAMKGANPVAANYLRSAVETIADRTLAVGKPLPADKLEAFVRDTKHSGPARRLAYDLLVRVDRRTPERLLPGMLDDPGAELRRDAVALLLREAQQRLDSDDRNGGHELFRKALKHVRDRDQAQQIAKKLKALGEEVDLTKHFGFITRWQVIGPFDNRDGKGFHTSFAPEKGVNLTAAYKGKDGKAVRWAEHVTKKEFGVVDFNTIYEELKGVTAYAFAAVESPVERPVEIRATSNNAVRFYLNGKEIFSREEYHHGTRMDQHVGRGVLKAGRNEILIKVCQNEQDEDWARSWSFQLRVTDDIGGAVPLTVVTGKGKEQS